MRELSPGLFHWEATHPEWQEGEPWNPTVSSYATDDGKQLLLFDPLGVPSEIEGRIGERDTAIVLTAPWHERDSEKLVQQHGMPVYSPLPDSAEYLMKTWGITAEQAGEGSPDLVWLFREGKGDGRPFAAGDKLPVGVEAYPGQKPNDLALWVESHNAVVVGDTLADFGGGPQINPRWLTSNVTREEVVAGLSPLLDLPVEHFLETHGGPFDKAALERALA